MDEAERDLESEMLLGARRALSPSAADQERVLLATRQALVVGSAAAAYAKATGGAASRAAVWKQVASAISIAAVSGAAGYYAGSHAQPARERAAIAQPAQPASTSPRAPEERAVAPNDTAADTADDVAPRVAGEHVAQDKPVVRVAARRSGGAGAASNAAAADPAPAAAPTRSREEITAMRRVERALREQQPQRALTLLFELDRSVPSGMLMQERQAAFAIARCAARLGSAVQLAAEFASRYPNSPYIARVRDACAQQRDAQRIGAPPETHD
jgi:hypothetical protein